MTRVSKFILGIIFMISALSASLVNATACTINNESGPSACPTSQTAIWPATKCQSDGSCDGYALGGTCCDDGVLKTVSCDCQNATDDTICGYTHCTLTDAE